MKRKLTKLSKKKEDKNRITIFILLVLLLFTSIAIVLSTQRTNYKPKAAGSTPTLIREEVVANDVTTGFEDFWGPHKQRIIRMSNDDLFLVYNSTNGYKVMHRAASGGWTQAYTGDPGTEPINILRGPSDEIHVFPYPNTQNYLDVKSTDMGKTFTTTQLTGNWSEGQGYAGAGASLNGILTVYQTDGDQPGHFFWSVYNPSTHQWTHNDTQIDYRYTYAFFLPQNNNQLDIVGTRDVTEATIGCSSNQNTYIFDSLKYYHMPNLFNPTQPTETMVKQEPCQASTTGDTTNIVIQGVDAYTDTQGRVHALYVDENSGGGHHAIIQNGQIIKDVPVQNVSDSYKMRIIQDATGKFYLLSMSGNTLTIQPGAAGDTDGTQFDTPVNITLQNPMTGYGQLRIAAPRGGTPLANYVDGHYNSNSSIVYFRVQLNNAAVSPSSQPGNSTPTPGVPSYVCTSINSICPTNTPTPSEMVPTTSLVTSVTLPQPTISSTAPCTNTQSTTAIQEIARKKHNRHRGTSNILIELLQLISQLFSFLLSLLGNSSGIQLPPSQISISPSQTPCPSNTPY